MIEYNPLDFSETRLINMYRLCNQTGYTSIFYGEEDFINKPFILWRHDIDIELSAVRKMAKIEHNEGIKSTYFFMINSWFYNIFSIEGRYTINYVKELGHQVGLHCDLEVGRKDEIEKQYIENKVEKDFSLLDLMYPNIFERKVSFHNPPSSVFKLKFESFYSTYQDKFFSNIKYLSDSNRIWREGSPEIWLNVNKNPKLSILLHPIIWAYPGESMTEGINFYLKMVLERQKEQLKKDDIMYLG